MTAFVRSQEIKKVYTHEILSCRTSLVRRCVGADLMNSRARSNVSLVLTSAGLSALNSHTPALRIPMHTSTRAVSDHWITILKAIFDLLQPKYKKTFRSHILELQHQTTQTRFTILTLRPIFRRQAFNVGLRGVHLLYRHPGLLRTVSNDHVFATSQREVFL